MEILPTQPPAKGAVVAFDNIKLKQCFPESDSMNACTSHQFRCSQTNTCINNTRVCDITEDCQNGDDETQNCGKLKLIFNRLINQWRLANIYNYLNLQM